MTDWQQQPGGLFLNVSRFDKHDAEHRAAALGVMRSTVKTVTQTHGAAFSENGFKNNIQAVYNGDLIVDLYLAKWEACQRKAVCLGAALGWDTYGFTPDGQLAKSFHTEDVCLLKKPLRELIRAKPQGKDFPEESLTACFERINMAQMAAQGIAYRYGEVDRDNTTMMRQLNRNDANMGTESDSAVLQYTRLPNNLMDSFPMDVSVTLIKWNGVESKRKFLATYKEDGHDLRLIATVGQATALGQERIDLKVWHNGNLPSPIVLNSVIDSTLLAIKRKFEEPEISRSAPCPVIPLTASRIEQFGALFNGAGSEIAIGPSVRSPVFGRAMPDAHVFVQNDADMMRGFLSHGAEPRLFGDKPMIPGVNIIRREAGLSV